MKLKNKVIVITGGTKGLGRALCLAFDKRVNKVIIAARLNLETNIVEKPNVLFAKTDVTKESEVKRLAAFVVEKFGRIDVWINNAGIWLPHAPIEDVDMERVRQILEVNLFGTIYGSKHALIQMRKQQRGVIVNILSSSALDGGIGSSGYCSSKFAASGFTKCLRLESENDGIEVISVYTRGIRTNFFNEKKPESYEDFMDPEYVAEKIIANIEDSSPKRDLIINNQENK